MQYLIETKKTFEAACVDLAAAVTRNGFGVLQKHDLGTSLRSKGVAFAEQCAIFEVCNPVHAGEVLAKNMLMNMALPCRISVFTEAGITKIGMFLPTALLGAMSPDPELMAVAVAVEEKTRRMIDEAG